MVFKLLYKDFIFYQNSRQRSFTNVLRKPEPLKRGKDTTNHKSYPQKRCLEFYQSKIRHINVSKITSIYVINLSFLVAMQLCSNWHDHDFNICVSLNLFWKHHYLKSVFWRFSLFTTTLYLKGTTNLVEKQF